MIEILINGQQLEMDKNTKFELVFKSPIFTDISKIVSNRTYTINLPKTTSNLKIIENANLPDRLTEFPYKIHTAEVWKNGLPIVQKGRAVLFEIKDRIEIAITWGNSSITSDMLKIGIRELSIQGYLIQWDQNSQFMYAMTPASGFLRMDYGQGIGDKRYIHPVYSCYGLLGAIEERFGVQINLSSADRNFLITAYIPILERNTGDRSANINVALGLDFSLTAYSSNEVEVSNNALVFGENGDVKSFRIFAGEILATFSSVVTSPTTNPNFYILRIFKNGEVLFQTNPTGIIDAGSETVSGVTTYLRKLVFLGQTWIPDFEVKSGDRITWDVRFTVTTVNMGYRSSTLSIAGEYIPERISFGMKFPISINLPDISCLDFLKTIMTLLGVFPYYKVDTPEVLSFFRVDDIYNNKPIAVDWTDKLIAGRSIDSLSYRFQDYAQRNYLRYKEDVVRSADGYIEVNDETLDKSRDILEMKFAASENRNDMAYIPLYTNENGAVKFNKLSPRIVVAQKYEDEGGTEELKGIFFPDLSMSKIISTRYIKYKEIVRQPKIVKGDFLLSDMDIFNLNMLVPVYLQQTGRYYAIINVQVGDNNVANCELLQM